MRFDITNVSIATYWFIALVQIMSTHKFNWRWWGAAVLFSCGFIGLLAGTSLSERPDVLTSGWLTKAYYALGFFVVGGLDVGMPVGGSPWGRAILWIAYFGSPLLTASAVIDAERPRIRSVANALFLRLFIVLSLRN